MHTSHIRIDLGAISGNIRSIRDSLAPGTEVCPVVKADAYGLGADRVARTMVEAWVRRLAVFTLEQAAELESKVLTAKILVLMPVEEIPNDPGIARLLASGRLELAVTSSAQAARLASIRLGRGVPVHVEVDCGMGRGGVSLDEAPALLEELTLHRSLDLVGIYTHFSSSDPEELQVQGARFDALLDRSSHLLNRRVIRHAASSGPCFADPTQQRDMVRIGLGWTGWLPAPHPATKTADRPALQPVVTWRSRMVQVRELEAGATVGYGSRWTAPARTLVGLVPVGYAHGYPMQPSDPRTPHMVMIPISGAMRPVPVVGSVSMDQLVVDLGGLPEFDPERDREVVLLSDQPDSVAGLHAIASRCGVPPHMILSKMAAGTPRVYLARSGRSVPSGALPRVPGAPAPSMAVG